MATKLREGKRRDLNCRELIEAADWFMQKDKRLFVSSRVSFACGSAFCHLCNELGRFIIIWISWCRLSPVAMPKTC
jgi:hypothetical protein